MSTEVEVVDGTALEDAIKSVRSDASADTFVVVGHVDGNPNKIEVVTVGQNNEEIASHMDVTRVLYAFGRYQSKVDMSTTIKFVFFRWIGDKVPSLKKGRFGVVTGCVEKMFNPYHVIIETNVAEEFEYDHVMQQLDENSGTKSKVVDYIDGRQMRGFTQNQVPLKSNGTSVANINVSRGSVKLEIDPSLNEQILAVRQNNSAWILVAYQDGNPKGPVVLHAQGHGTADELRENLADDQVIYGLYRISDQVDDIKTVKFVYIVWVGNEVKPLTRAKVSTHRGALEEVFGPAHVHIFASELSEITEEIIIEKVTSASGSKSHVK